MNILFKISLLVLLLNSNLQVVIAAAPAAVQSQEHASLKLKCTLSHSHHLNTFTLPAVKKAWAKIAVRANEVLADKRENREMANACRLALSATVLAASLAVATNMYGMMSVGLPLRLADKGMLAGSALFTCGALAQCMRAAKKWLDGPGPLYNVICKPLKVKKTDGQQVPSLSVKLHGNLKHHDDKAALHALLHKISSEANEDIAAEQSSTGLCNGLAVLGTSALVAGGAGMLHYLGTTSNVMTDGPATGVFAAVALGSAYGATTCVQKIIKWANGPSAFENAPSLAGGVKIK